MVTLILLFSESTQSAACCIVGPSDGEGAPPGDPIKREPREGMTGRGSVLMNYAQSREELSSFPEHSTVCLVVPAVAAHWSGHWVNPHYTD